MTDDFLNELRAALQLEEVDTWKSFRAPQDGIFGYQITGVGNIYLKLNDVLVAANRPGATDTHSTVLGHVQLHVGDRLEVIGEITDIHFQREPGDSFVWSKP